LRALPAARRARVLRRWIRELRLPPLPAQGVHRIEHELMDARADAAACFRWQDACVQAWGELLHADRVRTPLPAGWHAPWTGSAPLPLPGGGDLRLDGVPAFEGIVRVHARVGGERIRLPGRAHSHALKHVLQDLEVPPWERARVPLLSDTDGTLLAAGDLVLSAAFDAWLSAYGARLRWHAD
jgi:tRNA(Ile)-lysidine synthase